MVRQAAGELAPLESLRDPARAAARSQVRLYAEDPAKDFQPSAGRLIAGRWPPERACETWVESGTEITPYYDPMLAKIIVHGGDRPAALARMRNGARRGAARRHRDQPRLPAPDHRRAAFEAGGITTSTCAASTTADAPRRDRARRADHRAGLSGTARLLACRRAAIRSDGRLAFRRQSPGRQSPNGRGARVHDDRSGAEVSRYDHRCLRRRHGRAPERKAAQLLAACPTAGRLGASHGTRARRWRSRWSRTCRAGVSTFRGSKASGSRNQCPCGRHPVSSATPIHSPATGRAAASPRRSGACWQKIVTLSSAILPSAKSGSPVSDRSHSHRSARAVAPAGQSHRMRRARRSWMRGPDSQFSFHLRFSVRSWCMAPRTMGLGSSCIATT